MHFCTFPVHFCEKNYLLKTVSELVGWRRNISNVRQYLRVDLRIKILAWAIHAGSLSPAVFNSISVNMWDPLAYNRHRHRWETSLQLQDYIDSIADRSYPTVTEITCRLNEESVWQEQVEVSTNNNKSHTWTNRNTSKKIHVSGKQMTSALGMY